MKKIIQRFMKNMCKMFKQSWCFIIGHDMINEYVLHNGDILDGVWRSAWGNHLCLRCGKEHPWQWDRA